MQFAEAEEVEFIRGFLNLSRPRRDFPPIMFQILGTIIENGISRKRLGGDGER